MATTLTPIQEVVNHYLMLSAGLSAPPSPELCKIAYGRNVKPAKLLLEVSAGDISKAKVTIEKVKTWAKASGLSWSLNFVLRVALEPSLIAGKANQQDDDPYSGMEIA